MEPLNIKRKSVGIPTNSKIVRIPKPPKPVTLPEDKNEVGQGEVYRNEVPKMEVPKMEMPKMEVAKKRLLKEPDILARANPFIPNFPRNEQQNEYYYKRQIRHYGNTQVLIIGSGVTEQTYLFLCLCRQIKKEQYPDKNIVRVPIPEILKVKGVADTKETREWIYREFNKAINTYFVVNTPNITRMIRLIPEGGISNDKGIIEFSLSYYHEDVDALLKETGLGYHYVDLEILLSLWSNIAKSLYRYLITQQGFYNNSSKGYSIRLSKLCQNTGFQTYDRPWRVIWASYFKKACDELVKKKVLLKYSRDGRKYKIDGGIVYFYPGQRGVQISGQQKAQVQDKRPGKTKLLSGSKKENYGNKSPEEILKSHFDADWLLRVMKTDYKNISSQIPETDHQKLAMNLCRLYDWINEKQSPDIPDKDYFSPSTLIKEYIQWIGYNDHWINIEARIFDPDNGLFNKFTTAFMKENNIYRDVLTGEFVPSGDDIL